MDISAACAFFATLDLKDKAEFLAVLAHELTIVARDAYEVQTDGLAHPTRMRNINEIQHRLLGFLSAVLREDAKRFPDDALVRTILQHPEDTVLERQLARAFERSAALTKAAA